MGLKRVSWARRYQGQCRALRPLGHQGYRLRSYKKAQPLCSGYRACVLGSGFRLCPATPWGGVGVCVCLCARPAWSSAPPGCGCCAGVCGWAWVGAAPRHSWLGRPGVCVFVCRTACTPPFLAGVCCVGVRAWLGFRLCLPFLAGLLGCVCGCACAPLAPGPPGGPPVARGCAGVAVCGVCPPPPPLWFFCFFLGGGVSCLGFVVSVAGCHGLGSRGICPPIPSLLGRIVFFVFPSQRGVCLRVLGFPFPLGTLLPAWCCRFWLGGPPVPLWGVLSSVPSGWGVWPPLAVLVGGLVAVGRSRAPPPPVLIFVWGGACLFLPLPSLGWRRHWSAFSVVFRVAVGGCVLPGRAPAPWVGWVMCTLGSAPLPVGLGSGSDVWAAARGGFKWPWVTGAGVFHVLSPPRCRF